MTNPKDFLLFPFVILIFLATLFVLPTTFAQVLSISPETNPNSDATSAIIISFTPTSTAMQVLLKITLYHPLETLGQNPGTQYDVNYFFPNEGAIPEDFHPIPRIYQFNSAINQNIQDISFTPTADVIEEVPVLRYTITLISPTTLTQDHQIRIVTRVPYPVPIVIDVTTRDDDESSWSPSTFYRAFTRIPGQSNFARYPLALTPLAAGGLQYKAYFSNVAHLGNNGGLEKIVGLRLSAGSNTVTIAQVYSVNTLGGQIELVAGSNLLFLLDTSNPASPVTRVAFLDALPVDIAVFEIHFTLQNPPTDDNTIEAALYFQTDADGSVDDVSDASLDISPSTYSGISVDQYCVTIDSITKASTSLYLLNTDGGTNHQEYDYTFTIRKLSVEGLTGRWRLTIPQSMIEVMRFVQCRISSSPLGTATIIVSVADALTSFLSGSVVWNTDVSAQITCSAIFSHRLPYVSSLSPSHVNPVNQQSFTNHRYDFYNVVMHTTSDAGRPLCSSPPWFVTIESSSELQETGLPVDWSSSFPTMLFRPLHYGTTSDHQTKWAAIITIPDLSSPTPLSLQVRSAFSSDIHLSRFEIPTWTELSGAKSIPTYFSQEPGDISYSFIELSSDFSLSFPFVYGQRTDLPQYFPKSLYFVDVQYEVEITIQYADNGDPNFAGNDCLYQASASQNEGFEGIHELQTRLFNVGNRISSTALTVPPVYLPQITMTSDINGDYAFPSDLVSFFNVEIQILSQPLNFDEKPSTRDPDSCWDYFPRFTIYPSTTISINLSGLYSEFFVFNLNSGSLNVPNPESWTVSQPFPRTIRLIYIGAEPFPILRTGQPTIQLPIEFEPGTLPFITELSLSTEIFVDGSSEPLISSIRPNIKNWIGFGKSLDDPDFTQLGLLPNVSFIFTDESELPISKLLTEHDWTPNDQTQSEWTLSKDHAIFFSNPSALSPGLEIQSVDLYYYPQISATEFSTFPIFIKNLSPNTHQSAWITSRFSTEQSYERVFVQISIRDTVLTARPDIIALTPWFKILPACQSIEDNEIITSTCQSGTVCHPLGKCRPPQTSTHPICTACNSLTTISCDPLAAEPKCICQDGMTGPTCSESEQCEPNLTRTCQKNNGFVQLIDDQCSNTCVCYNAWAGKRCDSCTFQCFNSGKLYKDCNRCGCSEGYSGKHCQCNSVTGSITIYATNELVLSTQGKIQISEISDDEFSKMFDSKGKLIFSQTLVNLEQIDYLPTNLEMYQFGFINLIKDVFIGLQEPLLEIENGPFYLTISPMMGGDSKRTTFDFTIPFGCQESNPHITSIDKLTAQWIKFTAGFTKLDVIQKYFTFPNPSDTSTQTPLTPTPAQPPDDDEQVEPASGFVNGFFMVVIGAIAISISSFV